MGTISKLSKETIHTNFSGKTYFDLIIIGAGISGLSTALMYLKNTRGKKILILEKNAYVGGYSTTFRRGGYVFETTQLFPDIIEMMDYLGLDIKLKQYEKDFMRRIVVNNDAVDEYKIPAGPENFTRYLKSKFPDDADKIDKLMNYSTSMFSQVRKLKVIPNLKDTLITPFKAPKVIANLNRTYSGLLDKFNITNRKLRELMETFTSFSGVPSDMASSIYATGAMLIQKLNHNEKVQLSKYVLAVWLTALFIKIIDYLANGNTVFFDNDFSIGKFSYFLFYSIGIAFFIWYVVNRVIKKP